jgi:hypothetical protein
MHFKKLKSDTDNAPIICQTSHLKNKQAKKANPKEETKAYTPPFP